MGLGAEPSNVDGGAGLALAGPEEGGVEHHWRISSGPPLEGKPESLLLPRDDVGSEAVPDPAVNTAGESSAPFCWSRGGEASRNGVFSPMSLTDSLMGERGSGGRMLSSREELDK